MGGLCHVDGPPTSSMDCRCRRWAANVIDGRLCHGVGGEWGSDTLTNITRNKKTANAGHDVRCGPFRDVLSTSHLPPPLPPSLCVVLRRTRLCWAHLPQ